MAPSRGVLRLLRVQSQIQPISKLNLGARCITRFNSSLATLATDSSSKFQVYVSRSLNPYLNLSIEHYLLQKTPPESTILFLYTNKNCVVIGRNQNPWVEVNLELLARSHSGKDAVGPVDLVRRRSGGGTVFHDLGNVNYSVICPTPAFHRDKHAHMVVNALHSLGVDKAAVNERHDIILAGTEGTSSTGEVKPFKISGSAYKLTRLRSIHHGTCLLESPNLGRIGQYLKSPARRFITARGVDSVSSPIANVNIKPKEFEDAIVREFGEMYEATSPVLVDDGALDVPEIGKGYEELTSLDWTYLQTPQFSFTTHPKSNIATQSGSDSTGTLRLQDPNTREAVHQELHDQQSLIGGFKKPPPLGSTYLAFTARNGLITEIEASDGTTDFSTSDFPTLTQTPLHKIKNWRSALPDLVANGSAGQMGEQEHASVFGEEMNRMFGRPQA